MTPFVMVATIEHWLYLALGVVAAVLEIWALVDCATRGQQQFDRAGQRPKSFWLILTALAAAVGAMTVWGSLALGGGGFGILQVAALCVAGVYLAGPRSELKLFGNGGSSSYGY